MIPSGFIGLFLLFLFYKIKIYYNRVNVKYFLIGLFIPSIDFFLNVFLSLDYSFTSTLLTISKSTHLFHSIFTISLFILLNNILAIIFSKKTSQNNIPSILLGFLFSARQFHSERQNVQKSSKCKSKATNYDNTCRVKQNSTPSCGSPSGQARSAYIAAGSTSHVSLKILWDSIKTLRN